MSEDPLKKRRARGLSVGETVKLWQEFLAVNGLSPMGRAVRAATILIAFWNRHGTLLCRRIFRDYPKDIPILWSHDKQRFFK